MYLQTGEERRWLKEQRRATDARAAARPAAANAGAVRRADEKAAREDPDARPADAPHAAAGRAARLLRASLAGLAGGRHRTA